MPSSDIYDLEVIDQAFGRDADLYNDVLRVSYLASDGEIQSAFFDRRSELFAVLSKLSEEESDDDEILLSQRRFAERRMDAVVVCFRILKDPELRAIYEGERERRLSHRTTKQNPAKQSPTAVQSFDQDSGPERKSRRDQNEEPLRDDSPSRGSSRESDWQSQREVSVTIDTPPRVIAKVSKRERIVQESTPPRMSSKNKPERVVIEVAPPRKKEKQKVSRSHDTEITQNETLSDEESSRRAPPVVQQQQRGRRARREPPQDPIIDDEFDNQSLTSTTSKPASVFDSIKESKVVRTITEEVHGAYVDTVSAFDQVLNAFTLNESDITAVVGRIDKAKKQFRAPAPNERE